MARQFNGSTQYMSAASVDLSAVSKLTIAWWMYWDSFANDDKLAFEFSSNYNNVTTGFLIDPNSGSPTAGKFRVSLLGNVDYTHAEVTRPSAAVWRHYAVLIDKTKSSNEVDKIYFDGSSQSITFPNNANNTNGFASDTLYFMTRGGGSLFGAGRMCDVAIWPGVLLNQDEVSGLANGIPARFIHPISTMYNWPLLGYDSPEPEIINGRTASLFNSPTRAAQPTTLKDFYTVGNVKLTKAFSPADIAALKCWLKADAITGHNNNDPVSTWSDSSPNSNNATGQTAFQLYQTNVINSLPAVRIDASVNDYFTLPDFVSGFTEAEVFIVLKILSDPPSTGSKTGLWYFSGDSSLATHFPFTDGTIYDSFGTTSRKTVADPSSSLTNPHIYNVTSKSGEWTARLDGTQLTTTGTNTVGFNTNPTLGKSLGSIFMDGWIAEFILYNQGLTTTDRSSVLTYLKNKYGIS